MGWAFPNNGPRQNKRLGYFYNYILRPKKTRRTALHGIHRFRKRITSFHILGFWSMLYVRVLESSTKWVYMQKGRCFILTESGRTPTTRRIQEAGAGWSSVSSRKTWRKWRLWRTNTKTNARWRLGSAAIIKLNNDILSSWIVTSLVHIMKRG